MRAGACLVLIVMGHVTRASRGLPCLDFSAPREADGAGPRQASASAHIVLVSSLVLRRQAQARGPMASGKGFDNDATRPRPAGRQDGGHYGADDGVTTRVFGRRRPPFVRITCTRCSPSKWPIVGALPAQLFEERPRASINRASLHKGKGGRRREIW